VQPEVARAARSALAAALIAGAQCAAAIELGEARVRSSLGEPLDARIPFRLAAGEFADASCFALVRDSADGAGALAEGILTIERRRGEAALRVRTVAPVMQPTITLRVRASCPGEPTSATQQLTLAIETLAGATPSPVQLPAVVAQLRARSGDTLEAIAATVNPQAGEARSRYLAGLRQLNPSLEGSTIAEGTQVALPDPRTIRARREETRVAAALRQRPEPRERAPSAEAQKPPPVRAPRATAPRPAHAPKAAVGKAEPASSRPVPTVTEPDLTQERPAARTPAKPTPRTTAGAGSPFVLKLSSSEVDLSRSRLIDDRQRAQLRERLLILDADDQVAAMLSMRNSLRQLEARVADMQLKLDAMPASLAARTPGTIKVEPPKVEPSKAEVAPPKSEPPKAMATLPKPEPAKAEIAPPKPGPPKAEPGTPAKVAKGNDRDEGFSLPVWAWYVLAAILALLAIALAWRLRRRSQAEVEEVEAPARTVQAEPVAAARGPQEDEPIEIAEEVRPQMGSDAVLATRLPENAHEMRRRYIEERFPEIQNRTIVLEDPASVVKGARLFYEDGGLTRAVELLQFMIEERPQEVRPWLALFEIFRLERLTGEYAQLAERFHEHHGKGDYWRKVQYFGRDIDPANALYREAPLNTLETIGPREAKRLAAGLSSVGSAGTFDPIAENWLEAPMDFENEVLANELRMKLMAQAALTEQDLQPNPMPALRNIEMFTVA
jgi:hypothetical protein